MPPPVLTIAGSDCSAGAGAQADLKTITALGGYGLTALTSVVSETPAKVSRIQLLEASMVSDQIRVLAEAFPIAAAKSGMLGGAAQIEAVVEAWKPLAARKVPLVVDPVMVATSGGRLLDEGAIGTLTSRLFALARIVTPNMDEAAVLLGERITSRSHMAHAATELQRRFGCAVLLKGGHFEGDDAPDVLADAGVIEWYENRRIHGVHTHGTGCTLSAAIATELAKGHALKDAVRQAKAYVAQAIARHYRWGDVDALNHQHLQAPPGLASSANAGIGSP
jgi:hydroxymethylpyrimidine/phosphomethylpyrimidine kinase